MVVEVEGVEIDLIYWEGLMVLVGVEVLEIRVEMREMGRSWCLNYSRGRLWRKAIWKHEVEDEGILKCAFVQPIEQDGWLTLY